MIGHLWYSVVHHLLRFIFGVFCRMEVVGAENLENIKGACIIAGNHTCYYDPPLFGAVSKRRVNCIAQSTLFKVPVLRLIMKSLGAISVDRANPEAGTIKLAVEKLKNGEILGIFPEGRRVMNEEEEGKSSEKGVSLIAKMSGAPVVPFSIIGAKECITFHHKFIPRFKKVKVVVGEPMTYVRKKDREEEKANMKEFADELMRRIIAPVLEERDRNAENGRKDS